VLAAPVVPGLTDHELPAIIAAAAAAGARHAGYVLLRLPHAVKSLFTTWLENHFPDRRDKVLNRIRSLRGGELNDPRFGSRMRGEGIFAEQLTSLFRLAVKTAGIELQPPPLSVAHFRNPAGRQLELF
jgi:DNA repair photolyase